MNAHFQHHQKRFVIGVVLVAMVAVGIVSMLAFSPAKAENRDPAIARLQETGRAFAAVTEDVSPAVVFIKATKKSVRTGNLDGFGDLRGQVPEDLLRRFFGDQMPGPSIPQPRQPAVGQGSGFIISEEGHIVTNNHVVGPADSLEVTLHDGRVFEATVVGADPHTDVAIIKIDAEDLHVLPLGDSDDIQVGEWVLALGSPFGLTGTVTSGIVSAKGRNSMGITNYENFIQTDAAINPGNSGGPLVNLNGEAIGINTAILSRSGGYNGIGFAIPVNMAKDICQQLIDNGSVTRGFLGVIIQPLTPEMADAFGIEKESGVLIGDVTAGGPADRAGLKRGDVIVEMDGEAVEKVPAFRNRIAMVEPESNIELVVVRDGKRKTLAVEVGRLQDDLAVTRSETDSGSSLGLSVQTLDKQLAEELGTEADSGVVVTRVAPGSDAAAKGIRQGMIIQEVNQKPIRNARQFADAIRAGKDFDSILLLVRSGENTRYVVLNQNK